MAIGVPAKTPAYVYFAVTSFRSTDRIPGRFLAGNQANPGTMSIGSKGAHRLPIATVKVKLLGHGLVA